MIDTVTMDSNKQQNDNTQIKEIMKKIESDAEQKLKGTLFQEEEPRTFGSAAAKNNANKIESLKNIMADGAKEFEQKAGRPMTYGEMRMMFG